MTRVAINGYGRIGRMAHRVILQWHNEDVEVVAINAGHSTDLKGWMYLLKYDSVYGLLPQDVAIKPNPETSKPELLWISCYRWERHPCIFSKRSNTSSMGSA